MSENMRAPELAQRWAGREYYESVEVLHSEEALPWEKLDYDQQQRMAAKADACKRSLWSALSELPGEFSRPGNFGEWRAVSGSELRVITAELTPATTISVEERTSKPGQYHGAIETWGIVDFKGESFEDAARVLKETMIKELTAALLSALSLPSTVEIPPPEPLDLTEEDRRRMRERMKAVTKERRGP